MICLVTDIKQDSILYCLGHVYFYTEQKIEVSCLSSLARLYPVYHVVLVIYRATDIHFASYSVVWVIFIFPTEKKIKSLMSKARWQGWESIGM